MFYNDDGSVLLRKDTKANWTSVNPVLEDGELVIEVDGTTRKLKCGDGVTKYTSLPYISAGGYDSVIADMQDEIAALQTAQANFISKTDSNMGLTLFDMFRRYTNYRPADISNAGWNALGFCMIYYSQLNVITNQPSQWGTLINIPVSRGGGTESMQIWITQPSGEMYARGGNDSQSVDAQAWKKFTYTS